MRLAGIFNHNQTVTLRQFQDRIHIGHLPVQMDRNDGGDWTSTAPADQSSRIVDRALFFEILGEFCGIHVVGLLIDVHKLGQRAGLRNRLRSGNEGVRHSEDNVAGLHAAGHEREAQCVGSAADCYRIARLAEGRKCLLKILYHGATDKSGSPQGLLKNLGQLLFEFHMGSNQIEKRNAVGTAMRTAHFVASVICSIERRNFAGFPATMLLAGTSLVTTLPAPTVAFSPTVIFERIVAPEPIDAPFLMTVRSTFQSASVCRFPSAAVARG